MGLGSFFKQAAPVAGAVIGGYFGGPTGAAFGSQIGGMLGGSDDGELTALEAYNMQKADNINFWNMQNAYNDPSAQMARLKKAGLNPYMVYQGNAVGNTSSSIDTPTLQPHYAQPLSTRLTKALQNLNLRSMQADTKGKEVDTEMRELNLAIKKAQLARLTTGRLGNSEKINSYGLRNPNNWTFKKFLPALFNSVSDTTDSDAFRSLPVYDASNGYSREMLLG